MLAIIRAPTIQHQLLEQDVLGAPWIHRQIEWLKASGCKRILVEKKTSPSPIRCLRKEPLQALGLPVTILPANGTLPACELIKRIALSEEERAQPFLEVPGEVLGVTPLPDLSINKLSHTSAISEWTVRLYSGEASSFDVVSHDQLYRYEGEASFLHFLETLMTGDRSRLPFEIRGTETSPGIFRAAGSTVNETAHLKAPVYIGRQCDVGAHVQLGPCAILEAESVLEERAHIHHARVAQGVVVGQGLQVHHAAVLHDGIRRHSGRTLDLGDELLVGKRTERSTVRSYLSKISAESALRVMNWFGKTKSPLSEKIEKIIHGQGVWIGPRSQSDSCVFDIEDALVPSDATDEEREMARRWYASQKSLALDLKLLMQPSIRERMFK